MVVGFGVFSMGSSDLHVVFVSNLLELLLLRAEVGKMNVDRGAKSGTQVGGA